MTSYGMMVIQALFSLFNQIFYFISDAVYKSSIYYFYLLFSILATI